MWLNLVWDQALYRPKTGIAVLIRKLAPRTEKGVISAVPQIKAEISS
jgi:hypothetical protein